GATVRWIRPCQPLSSKGTAPGRGDPGHTSHPARRAVQRASGARTRFARYWGPFDSPVARADDPGGLKPLPLIITSIAESLVRCRNSGVRAIPRVAAGAANDLATEFEGRSAADVAGWRRVRIDETGPSRFCRVHSVSRPADDWPPLQDEDPEARFRQTRRRDETVVTAADDDRVPQVAHGLRSARDLSRVSAPRSSP